MAGARVMVVEDVRHMAHFVKRSLERAGYEVHAVHHGDEVLPAIDAFAPRAIILDLVLPGKSGLEICRALKRDPRHEQLRILIVTGHSFDDASSDEIRDAGADWHFTKPVSPVSLRAKLAELGVPHAGVRPVPRVTPALQPLAGATVRVTLRERVLSRRSAPNVLALVPGADSTAPVVLVAAHLDGLGVGPVLGSDSIYNGADDNASGVAAVLEAARLLAMGPPPPAPVVFAFFSGTEQLLLGSSYYLGHPAVPLSRTAAMVNVEAVGRNLRDSLAVVGAAQSGLARTIDALQPAATAIGLTLVPDPWPSRRFWLLGDHGRFRERGVPILYLFNGQHGDLHHPGDESRKIAFAAVARIARFVALVAGRLTAPLSSEGAVP